MSFRNFQNIIEDLSLYLEKSDRKSSIFFLPAKKKSFAAKKKIYNPKPFENIEKKPIIAPQKTQVIKKDSLIPIEEKKELHTELKVEEKKQTHTEIKVDFLTLETKKSIDKFSLSKKEESNFEDILKIIKKIDHTIEFTETLDDIEAKKIAKSNNFKNSFSIAILAYKEDEKKYIFLSKLKQALEIYFFPTELVSAYSIEKENKWPDFFAKTNLKFIISSDYTISELENLKKYYLENPSKNEKFLNNISLFLLPDISLYLKEPSLKASLFKTLKQKIISIHV